MNATPEQTPAPARSRHLLIAIIVAALLVFLARYVTDRILPPQTSAAPLAAAAAAPAPEPASAPLAEEEDPAALQIRQERIAREKLLAENDRIRREQKLQKAIAQRDQAAELARLDHERVEQAWSRFYKKPKKCDNASDQSVIVDCGNHYIRERQRFDKLWAEGKIKG